MTYVNKDSFATQYRSSLCGKEDGITPLAGTTKALLNKSGKVGYYCLFSGFKVEIFSCSPLNRMLIMGFPCMPFIRLTSPSNILPVFIKTRYWVLTNTFFV